MVSLLQSIDSIITWRKESPQKLFLVQHMDFAWFEFCRSYRLLLGGGGGGGGGATYALLW